MKRSITTTILLSSISLITALSLGGCSEDKQETTPEMTQNVSSSKIEVVANANSNEIKVKERDHNGSTNNSYYYDYNIKSSYSEDVVPANEDASVRVHARSAIDANMHVRSPYEEVQVSLMVKRLSKNFIVKCSACHNDYANGVIGPSLLGKDSNYIYNAIADFKSGKKENVLMKDLINNMNNQEIRQIADEIYNFNLELQKMRSQS